MPHEVSLRGPSYSFECYGVHEAKRLGLVDSWEREGTHAPVSTIFEQGEGKLLADWVAKVPDALLVATGRYQITVYRPKSRLLEIPDEEDEVPVNQIPEVIETASGASETIQKLAS